MTVTAPAPGAGPHSAGPHGTDLLGDGLESVLQESVAPQADLVDRDGRFPAESIAALRRGGVLGLMSPPELGGGGAGLAEACQVIERLAAVCGSTAMVLLMHYAATTVIEAYGPEDVRRSVAGGSHLSTLAFSETGTRSHFWVPAGTATTEGDTVRLDAKKSWVTSAGRADSYVWSSRALSSPGPMTMWLVPSATPGLQVQGDYDGFGLRGNASSPVTARGVSVPASAMLGPDGSGLDVALEKVLPCFLVLSAAFSLGVMEALTAIAREHLMSTRLVHLDRNLSEQPVPRQTYARLRMRTDGVRTFLDDTLTALAAGRENAMLRVLQAKAVAAEAAGDVADGVMRLCGGSAFRRELGVERRFRDALAARVMAPTTEALYDFAGRAELGLPLFEEAR
ncbi:acyl-CoA dehydrogenase family protein [Streptomyces sp. NPDC051320]|uniref:acyl-CoA dehydrogenase family protein n=1 Tax=Streptomyces sp. NPDC051320 TaxID=3154644 RepID=UPI003432475D